MRSLVVALVAARCNGLASDHGVAAAAASPSSGSSLRRAMLAAAAVATTMGPKTAFAAPVATSPDGTAVTLRLGDGSTQSFPAQPLPSDYAKGLKLPITDITDKVFGFADYAPEYPLTPKDMKRLDESDDSSFYGEGDGALAGHNGSAPPTHPPTHPPVSRPATP